MSAEGLIRTWFCWRKTANFLQHDREKIAEAPVRFPKDYAFVLEQFENKAMDRQDVVWALDLARDTWAPY